MIAEATTVDILSGTISQVGVVGALIWFLWYSTSVTGPKRDDEYRKSIESVTDKMSIATERFTNTLGEERKSRIDERLKNFIRDESACRYNADHNKSDLPIARNPSRRT
jgi:hypothetical protein